MDHAEPFQDGAPVGLGGTRADLLFDVLAHPYRRFGLWYLWRAGGHATVSEIARELHAWQSRAETPDRGVSGTSTLALSLRHTHLPKAEEAGVVAVDGDDVVLTDGAEAALVHLAEVVEE